MARLTASVWSGRKVLVTGHTGFKGSWLAQMLQLLGSRVAGYSLAPDTDPSHFECLDWNIDHVLGDVRDLDALGRFCTKVEPELVIHMAAQPLVLRSYRQPRDTFEVNVMGTLNVLEAVRATPSVRAVLIVTSDKCYENEDGRRCHGEADPMGGHDPYSASKSCAEILTTSYRRSFFNPESYGAAHSVLLASARAGNVLGGGDWAADRLVPDFARAYRAGQKVVLRNPRAVRPWQYVLDPLFGYLLISQQLLEGNVAAAKAWNLGPDAASAWTVEQIADCAAAFWKGFRYEVVGAELHEAASLTLDSTMASTELGWKPIFDVQQTLEWTLGWYEAFLRRGEVSTRQQIAHYLERRS